MSKYIDAERLKSEIRHLKIDVYDEAHQFDIGARSSLTFLESFIDSLQHELPNVDLENYISNKLRELGADLINHKLYSFNRGLNVGKTNAYNDILDRLNARKEK